MHNKRNCPLFGFCAVFFITCINEYVFDIQGILYYKGKWTKKIWTSKFFFLTGSEGLNPSPLLMVRPLENTRICVSSFREATHKKDVFLVVIMRILHLCFVYHIEYMYVYVCMYCVFYSFFLIHYLTIFLSIYLSIYLPVLMNDYSLSPY